MKPIIVEARDLREGDVIPTGMRDLGVVDGLITTTEKDDGLARVVVHTTEADGERWTFSMRLDEEISVLRSEK